MSGAKSPKADFWFFTPLTRLWHERGVAVLHVDNNKRRQSMTVAVRNACARDIARLVEIETLAWKDEGTEVYHEGHFWAWLELYPQGFFVAEEDGAVVGFTYTEAVYFNPNDTGVFTSFNDITDSGYTRKTHRQDGDHHFGVTICSISKGAGKILLRALLDFSNAMRRPLLGFSRITGFADYLESAIASGASQRETLTKEAENEIALWYALECAKMAEGNVWDGIRTPSCAFVLPPVSAPDPVLRFYLQHKEFFLYAILPDFLHDSKSRDYSVLFGQKLLR